MPVLLGSELDLEAPDLAGVGEARHFVRRFLVGWGLDYSHDDAEIITSELVTNALVHGGTPIRLRVRVVDSLLLIEVTDPGGGAVSIPPLGHRDIGGQGLRLVSALASAWGVYADDIGKTVWAELPH